MARHLLYRAIAALCFIVYGGACFFGGLRVGYYWASDDHAWQLKDANETIVELRAELRAPDS